VQIGDESSILRSSKLRLGSVPDCEWSPTQQSRIRMSFCVNVIGYVCLARGPSVHWQDGPNVSRNRNVGQTDPIIVAAD
jgi:hypothetical protein